MSNLKYQSNKKNADNISAKSDNENSFLRNAGFIVAIAAVAACGMSHYCMPEIKKQPEQKPVSTAEKPVPVFVETAKTADKISARKEAQNQQNMRE